jgi:hypothetical protein
VTLEIKELKYHSIVTRLWVVCLRNQALILDKDKKLFSSPASSSGAQLPS